MKSSPEEEGVAETRCGELTTAPVFIPLCCFREEVRKLQVELRLERREEWE